MKILILVLALAAAAAGARDRRSYAHTQAYPVPVSVHTEVRPSNSLPVYEYPESTQIDTHARTVYTVQVPITHTVTLEQPSHSRQVVYHAPPAYQSQQVYQPAVYSPSVYQAPVYTPSVYQAPVYQAPAAVYNVPTVYRTRRVYASGHPWVYRRSGSTWC